MVVVIPEISMLGRRRAERRRRQGVRGRRRAERRRRQGVREGGGQRGGGDRE